MADDRLISKTVSYWLRHNPSAGALVLDASGWARFHSVVDALLAAGLIDGSEDLLRVVDQSDKSRFEISSDGSSIRARQGHSIAVNLEWPIQKPPAVLYHGTIERFLPPILAEGLKPMSRHHVHLSGDKETARIVGARRGKPVLLEIAAGALFEEGVPFQRSTNGVWLVAHVPAAHLRVI